MDTLYQPTLAAESGAKAIAPQRKHSGLGIASLVASCVAGLIMFGAFALVILLSPSLTAGRNSAGLVLVGLLVVASMGLALTALGLGIAGMFQRERKKMTAGLGMLFSVLILAIVLVLMLLGRNAPRTLNRHAHVLPRTAQLVPLKI